MPKDWKGLNGDAFEGQQRQAIEAVSQQLHELSAGIAAIAANKRPGTNALSSPEQRLGVSSEDVGLVNRTTVLPDGTYNDVVISSPGTSMTVTGISIPGSQGDVLYHNGTDWVTLPAGTDGKVLGTQGAGANPRWQPVVANGVYVDNVTDLEAAVNGASAGAVIYVAAGNYQLTGTLVLDVSRIKIIGAGRDATYLRGLNENTDIISIQADSVMVADLSLQHSSFAGGTGNGKGSAGSGRGIVFEMEVTSSDNYGSCIIERLNILNTASWGIYDTGVYSMEDISYGDGFASAGLFSNTAEHPFPIWGYKTAIDSTTVAGIPVKADVSAVSTWDANSRTITSTGAFTNVRVGNYVYDVAGDIPHGTYVTAKASDSSITISKSTTALGAGVTLYFSRRTNCRVTVKNIINDVNFAFQNSGGAMYVGYGATTTYIKDIKTNNYSFGSFCAHNDTTPSAACTRGAVDIYGTIVTDLYSPIFQSPSKQSGVVVTAHDDTDATMLSIRYAGSVHVYSAYFETLSSNLEDGVDWRARGADAYGYRQYWFITGYNSSDVVFHAPFFVCSTSRKLDPAWLVGGVYYAGFPARLVRTLADAGGFAFTMLGGRVSQWREFYHASLFGHATPPAPFAYGDFYPCEENGVDTANPWDDDDFLLEGTSDGSVTQPINIEDLEISNHMNGFRREPTAPKAAAIFNRPCFRMHNNGRTLKLGAFEDIAAYTGGTSDMDNASDRLALSQPFKGGHFAYVFGTGDGDGSVQREGLWGISNNGHDWRQIPWIRKHPSIWPNVYAGDLWMQLGSAAADVYQTADFRWYDGSYWRDPVLAKTAGGASTDPPETVSDNAIVRYDGTTGKVIQKSGITIADGATGTLSGTNSGDQTITLTGDVTGSGTGSFAATIGSGKVTYAKIQNTANPGVLIGRQSGSAGTVEEITLGTNLSMSGTTLNAAAGSGTAVSGIATVDFGAVGAAQATVTVASVGVAANSNIVATMRYGSTAGRDLDELEMDDFALKTGNIVPGVSFDILVTCLTGYGEGLYDIHWIYV